MKVPSVLRPAAASATTGNPLTGDAPTATSGGSVTGDALSTTSNDSLAGDAPSATAAAPSAATPVPTGHAGDPATGLSAAAPLTVLLTVYNGMPYLRETVESVFAQRTGDALPCFVFRILDNGSGDAGGDFLDTLKAPAHIELVIEHLPHNIGRTAVLNRGLAAVTTPLTAIIDADDIALPDRLLKQAAFMLAHPNIDLLGCDVTYINPAGGKIGEMRVPQGHSGLRDHFPLFNPFAHAAVCFRTEAARKAGGYPEHTPYAQDLALWIAMLKNGAEMASLAEPLAKIRMHPGQATRTLIFQRARQEDAAATAAAMQDIPGLSKAALQAARLRLAGALWNLGRKKEALAALWHGITESPLLFPCNPLLLRRLLLMLKRRFASKP